MPVSRILAVMDPIIHELLCQDLSTHYDVSCTQALRPTLQELRAFDPHVLLIDIDGNTITKVKRMTQAAKAHYRRPYVVLIKSGRAAPKEIKHYDKLISKPFVFRRLRSNIDKLLASRQEDVWQLPPFTLDLRTQLLQGPHGLDYLSPKLTGILSVLFRRHGQIVTTAALLDEVWHLEDKKDGRTVHVHMHWLRNIMEEDAANPQYLKTATGTKGYLLDLPGPLHIGGKPLLMKPA